MNIVVLTDEWSPDTAGGVARVAVETSRRLAERGHRLTVVVPRRPGVVDDETGNPRVLRVVRRGRLPRTATDVRAFARALSQHGLRRPDVAIAHQVTTAAAALSAGIEAPLVFAYHASAWREAGLRGGRGALLRPFLRTLERFVVRRASIVIVLSDYSRELLLRDHPDVAEKIVVVPGGVDGDLFHPADGRAAARRRIGLSSDRRLVLAVRRLEPALGLEPILDAIATLPDVELALIGEGRLRARLEERAEELGISARVRLVGRVESAELADWYRAADVYVQPPAPHEGFGLAIVEALASATPAVGAAVGAVPELLAPLDGRLLAPRADAAHLAAAISSAPDVALDMRTPILRKHAWPVVVDRWERVLTETAAGREERIEVLGAPLDPITFDECLVKVDRAIADRRSIVHTSVNAAKIVRLQHDPVLRDALWAADLSTADGQPIVWAARILGRPLPERVAGIDLMERLIAQAEVRGYGIYLLGARPEVVEATADEVRRRHPRIRISGLRDGYFKPEEDAAVAAEIAAVKPDMLFVALETPRKELFLAERRAELGVPFAMGVGGAFDVLAGTRARAPRWAQRLGLEWAFRLAQEPRRLGIRYVRGNASFVALFLTELRRRPTRRR